MSDSCNSRHFSWLMKSCFPNPNDNNSAVVPQHHCSTTTATTTLNSLPDDLLLECLSRVASSSIPSLSLVCRRWARLLQSPPFFQLRRRHGLLHHTLFAISASNSATDSALFAATLQLDTNAVWKVSCFITDNDEVDDAVSYGNSFHRFPSNARLTAIGHRVYIIGRNATLRYDTWSGKVTARSPMMFPRKKFAVASVSGKIYVTGGGQKMTAVEEYDPEEDKWVVATHATRSRYGCIGASVDGVFYVIGGLKLGGASRNELSRAGVGGAAGPEAHVYASSMDLYDVEAREWLRSRAVPGGGCVVAACAAGGHIYVLASHAVELSFWRFEARRKVAGAGGGFGEWCRINSPPLPAQIRVDGTVRFSCVGVGEKVVLVQVSGCIDDLLRRSGRFARGLKESLVLVYDPVGGGWTRSANLPEMIRRAACACADVKGPELRKQKTKVDWKTRLGFLINRRMDRGDDQSPAQGGTARILVEFLEVAITSIVFLKGVYPTGAFERRRYMNMVVQRARHPELRDYIHSAVSGLLPFIQKGLVERLAVIFYNTGNTPVEKFMFKLAVNQSYGSKVEEADLEFSLRSFLVKLSISEPLTRTLSHDCRWEITAYFRSLPQASTSKDAGLWIPTDTKQWQRPPLITPIKSMNSEPLCVQLYLEHPTLNEPKP
ncbi:hypothetical protein FNV43_RR05709 [Rhamnella rubrinervis]|uniref:F-box domain-containing protein n=1 Tax=Rhamnella rubrinervis TaxID=2594499 RepID=A0A8K0HMK5_9ROSA|nr:hypothetical protein FNV43_RR05709 [Rhamnella rubrinervis]